MESSAELLKFLHEFSLASSPRQAKVAAGQHVGRADAVGRAAVAPALWAPPVPAERFHAVPFKPLAIVPLPRSGTSAAEPVTAATPEPAPAPRQELLPPVKAVNRHHGHWQRRAMVGGMVGGACAALTLGILSIVSPGPAHPAGQVINSPANVIVARPPAARAQR